MKRIAAAAVLLALVVVILFVAGPFDGDPSSGANDEPAIETAPVDPDDAARKGTALEGSPRAPDVATPPAPNAAPATGPPSAAAPARVTVTVLGPGKAPIAGARVRLVVPGSAVHWDAVSDVSGKARFDAVPVPDVWIWTWALGFLPADAYFTPTLDALKAGEERSDEVVTEADGRFRFTSLPRRRVVISTRSLEFLDLDTQLDLTREVRPVTLTLHRGGVLRVVLSATAGRPPAGTYLRVGPRDRQEAEDPEAGFAIEEVTDDEGGWRVRLPAGRYVLEAVSPEADGKVLAQGEVTLAEGQTTRLELKAP